MCLKKTTILYASIYGHCRVYHKAKAGIIWVENESVTTNGHDFRFSAFFAVTSRNIGGNKWL
jgi:hypothetical protein